MKEQSSDKICKPYAELISDYLDGQLIDEQMTLVENHIKECSACAEKLQQYRQIKNLILADKQKAPVDLTATVLANLEREQLLTGLDELAKPTTPFWTKLLKSVAAAAMIGLVVYVGVLIVQFTETTQKPTHIISAPPQSFSARFSGNKKEDLENKLFADAKTIGKKNKDISSPFLKDRVDVATTEIKKNKPAPPLALRPTPPGITRFEKQAVSDRLLDFAEIQSAGETPADGLRSSYSAGYSFERYAGKKSLAQQIPLTLNISVADMPTWMLVKEQILEVLNKENVPQIQEPDQVHQALTSHEEFFYQAKKGLDLPPGETSSQILLVVSPEKFRTIQNDLQQSAPESVTQKLHHDLEKILKKPSPTSELSAIFQQTRQNLNNYFVNSEADLAFGKKATTLPAPVQTQPINTKVVTTSSQKVVSEILPLLINIQLNPKSPTTATTQ
ncbi:MAG: zf-HC2 domain-containing protein [Phycisphaerae bacterium]